MIRFSSSSREPECVPHARQELHETTVSKGNGNDDIGLRNAPGSHVDQTQHERGQGEGTQSQWGRVGELAALDALVGTWLKLTTEGGQQA